MRTRDEVLRYSPFIDEMDTASMYKHKQGAWVKYEDYSRMADRIRELEAQQALPPIREKFVRVSDELVAELKAAPGKPVTVAIVEDGNELYLIFREVPAPVAASEPVAWAESIAVYVADQWFGPNKYRDSWDDHHRSEWVRAFREATTHYARPSAAAVTVTEAMVEAAARALCDGFRAVHVDGDDYQPFDRCTEEGKNVWRGLANTAIRSAMKHAASEGASA